MFIISFDTDIRVSVIVLLVYNPSNVIIKLNALKCWIDT